MTEGDLIDVEVRGVAHGGSMVAHLPDDAQRRTVLVRHALPGEAGRARITAIRGGGRLIFADLVQVRRPDEDRVEPPCPYSGPGGCGGCDFQHVRLTRQLALKADVVRDALRRIAGVDDPRAVGWDGRVHGVPGDEEGLRWRTRGRFAAAEAGLAMHRWRSASLVPVEDCVIACREVVSAAAASVAAHGGAHDGEHRGEVVAVATSTGSALAGPVRQMARQVVTEKVRQRTFQVAAGGFWQVHPGAPQALLAAVAAVLEPRDGEALLDLYGGVGLFAASLSPHLGGAPVHLVEGDAQAARLARRNLAEFPSAQVHRSAVADWLRDYRGRADLVVLDPPRTGAGGAVLRELHRLRPRAVAYVACDPAALARDIRTALDLGWRVKSLRALDMFPMTHHIECVAAMAPASQADS